MIPRRSATALVSLDAVRRNLERLRATAPGRRVLAVVKANAYGHGIGGVLPALKSVDGMAVATVEEGVALRGLAVACPVVVLEGALRPEEYVLADRHRLDLVVHTAQQVEALAALAPSAPLTVWLKLDTGMNRLGFRTEQVQAIWERLRTLPAVGAIRIMTHLARSEDRDHPMTGEQIHRFEAATRGWPGDRSIANSGGIFAWPESHADWIRPGLSLYGVSPFPDGTGTGLGLEPAMTLQSYVIAIREVAAGESVGYGAAWTAMRPSRIAVVGIGYGDGYPRHTGPDTRVLVNGVRCPLAGRVSMDMISVDVTDLPEVRTGDRVVLWGMDLPVEEVAASCGTIPWTLLCAVTDRVTLVHS